MCLFVIKVYHLMEDRRAVVNFGVSIARMGYQRSEITYYMLATSSSVPTTLLLTTVGH